MEAVLTQIVRQQADLLILDMTGVPTVDSAVASHLLQMARAVQVLGAQIVVIGIGPEMGMTIIQLGLDLTRVTILANLEAHLTQRHSSRRFGGLQALHAPFLFLTRRGVAPPREEQGDRGEAKPPQTPPLRKVS